MRTFVMGDPHGGHKAMKQCLKRAKFNYDLDQLICLGDVCDGWPETPQCIEELLKIKNLIYIRGNHDMWLGGWLNTGDEPKLWTSQGGKHTIAAYMDNIPLMTKHQDFFDKAEYYYIDSKKRLFVHGGYDWRQPIEGQIPFNLMWDRELWLQRHNEIDISPYEEVFVGHTSIWNISKFPQRYNKVWFLDTGGGYEGKLTIMDVDSKEFWQSDKVSGLYLSHQH